MSGPAPTYTFDIPDVELAEIANWQAIERAIHTQIVIGSGLPAARVIWENQTRDRPGTTPATRDLITLFRSETVYAGMPEEQISDNPDSTLGDGLEILIDAIEHARTTVRVSFYSGKDTGNDSAAAKASRVRAYLQRGAVCDLLNDSGIALIGCGPVQSMPALLETEFESRAIFEIELGVADGSQEKNTFIESAEWSVDFTT